MADTHPTFDREISVSAVVGTVLFLAIAVAAAMFGMSSLERSFLHQAEESDPALPVMSEARELRLPPAPRLQAQPQSELANAQAEDRFLLDGYGWVDRSAGRVRIPIEEAMLLITEQNLGEAPEASETEPPSRPGPEETTHPDGTHDAETPGHSSHPDPAGHPEPPADEAADDDADAALATSSEAAHD